MSSHRIVSSAALDHSREAFSVLFPHEKFTRKRGGMVDQEWHGNRFLRDNQHMIMISYHTAVLNWTPASLWEGFLCRGGGVWGDFHATNTITSMVNKHFCRKIWKVSLWHSCRMAWKPELKWLSEKHRADLTHDTKTFACMIPKHCCRSIWKCSLWCSCHMMWKIWIQVINKQMCTCGEVLLQE